MYGNTSFGETEPEQALTAAERRRLRRELASVAAHTRELLPDGFAVGLELAAGADGPRATVAVQPPVGSVVSAGYAPDDPAEIDISEDERTDIAQGLAASAALEVKKAMRRQDSPAAR
jgi:hypothetical protein